MKNTIKTITLAVVLTFGTTFANAGLMMSDKSNSSPKTAACQQDGGVLSKDGIIIIARQSPIVFGIVNMIAGLLASDRPCTESKDGILVGDRGGILVSD